MAELMDTTEFTSGPKISSQVAYNQRDLIMYALGIGSTDPRYIYENHDEFSAFPTYPIVLLFKGASFDALPFPPPVMMSFPFPPVKGVRVPVDAEKIIEKVADLPKEGATLNLVGRTVGIHQKGKGALVEQEFELVDDSGKVYYRMVSGNFLVGAKEFKDSGKTYSQSIPVPSAAPTHIVETPTNEHIASLYRLSGDYNPLHVDPTFAQFGGFEKPIMHGLCTMGHVVRAILDTVAGGNSKRFQSVQVRFASPVFPGQTLVTEMWRVSATEYIFQTKVKETGKVCVANARLLLTPEGKL